MPIYAPVFEALYVADIPFLQLTPPANLPPLDLMIVDQTTFDWVRQKAEGRSYATSTRHFRFDITAKMHVIGLPLSNWTLGLV